MDQVTLDPYLFFKGNCREAMEFYKSVFGGELSLQTYGETPGNTDPATKDHIMHASLEGTIKLYASDTAKASPTSGKVSLCLGGEDEERLHKIFDGLSAGGEVRSPLKKEFWGDTFGSLTDKYGVEWMVNIAAKKPQ
ncbi:MAG TPA: VOC family protein [Candidatus Saccharimonadales bacterium]|nr:VOC family protein [Candidatus Saccharimonadales bacterium]